MTLTNNGGVYADDFEHRGEPAIFTWPRRRVERRLPPNAACTVLIVFAPTAGGARARVRW